LAARSPLSERLRTDGWPVGYRDAQWHVLTKP
jgi:hypothetical protein